MAIPNKAAYDYLVANPDSWRDYKAKYGSLPDTVKPPPAPAAAVSFLEQNPDSASDFEEKFGYNPVASAPIVPAVTADSPGTPEGEPGILGNLGQRAKLAAARVPEGVATLARQGIDKVDDFGKELLGVQPGSEAEQTYQKFSPMRLNRAVYGAVEDKTKEWEKQAVDAMSPDVRASLEKSIVERDETGGLKIGEGARDPWVWTGLALDTGAAMVPGLGVTAKAARLAYATRYGQALAQTAARKMPQSMAIQFARKEAQKAAVEAGVAAGGLTEGTVTGGMNGAQVEQTLNEVDEQTLMNYAPYREMRDQGLSHEVARAKVSRDQGFAVALATAASTALTGAPLNAWLAKWAAHTVPAASRAATAVKGVAAEGAQEFVQEGTEQVLQNKGEQPITGKGTWDGVLENAITGAIVGGAFGGGFGAAFGDHAPGKGPLEPVDQHRAEYDRTKAVLEQTEEAAADPSIRVAKADVDAAREEHQQAMINLGQSLLNSGKLDAKQQQAFAQALQQAEAAGIKPTVTAPIEGKVNDDGKSSIQPADKPKVPAETGGSEAKGADILTEAEASRKEALNRIATADSIEPAVLNDLIANKLARANSTGVPLLTPAGRRQLKGLADREAAIEAAKTAKPSEGKTAKPKSEEASVAGTTTEKPAAAAEKAKTSVPVAKKQLTLPADKRAAKVAKVEAELAEAAKVAVAKRKTPDTAKTVQGEVPTADKVNARRQLAADKAKAATVVAVQKAEAFTKAEQQAKREQRLKDADVAPAKNQKGDADILLADNSESNAPAAGAMAHAFKSARAVADHKGELNALRAVESGSASQEQIATLVNAKHAKVGKDGKVKLLPAGKRRLTAMKNAPLPTTASRLSQKQTAERKAEVEAGAKKAPARGVGVVQTRDGEWTTYVDRKAQATYTDEATARDDIKESRKDVAREDFVSSDRKKGAPRVDRATERADLIAIRDGSATRGAIGVAAIAGHADVKMGKLTPAGAKRLSQLEESVDSKDTATRTGTGPGVTRKTLEGVQRQIRDELGVDLRLAETENDLPQAIQDDLPGGIEGVKGIFHRQPDGTTQLWLVAKNQSSRQDAYSTAIHEAVGHDGLRAVLKDSYSRTMRDIRRNFPKEVRAAARRNKISWDHTNPVTRELMRNLAAEELVAYAAERVLKAGALSRPRSTFARIVSAIRDALRKAGVLKSFSQQDIEDLILRARDYTRDGRVTRTAAQLDYEGDFASAASKQTPDALQASPVFYSQLLRNAESMKRRKGTADEWLSTLKNMPGTKQEEMDWVGLTDWINALDRPVTKEEVTDFIRANQIEVQEVIKGGESSNKLQREHDQAVVELTAIGYHIDADDGFHAAMNGLNGTRWLQNLNGDWIDNVDNKDSVLPDKAKELANRVLQLRTEIADSKDDTDSSETRYGQYTLPGGQNYRELLLTLPPKRIPEMEAAKSFYESFLRKGGQPAWDELTDAQRNEYARTMPDVAKNVQPSDSLYRSSHWHEPNILAHARFDERTDVDGKGVLHIAEIQSDMHQEGRRKGYSTKSESELPTNWKIISVKEAGERYPGTRWVGMSEGYAVINDATGESVVGMWGRNLPTFRDAKDFALRDINKNRIPNAPFKTTWPELSFKRMLRYAAENNFERITWDTGEVNADRYDLSKRVSRVTYHAPESKLAKKYGTVLKAFDLDGAQVINEIVAPEKLEDYIGKDAARKLLETEPKGDKHELAGLDLKVGGEGMAAFYDKILPAAVNKMVKKWGGKVSSTEVITGFDGKGFFADTEGREFPEGKPETVTVHSVDITPQMREAVPKGLSLFSVRGSNKKDERNLVITHNISAEKLLRADKLGGLAVPSLAIVKADTPLEGFGDITLVGTPAMADPKGYAKPKVFGADIYSPRYPNIEVKLSGAALKKLNAALAPFRKEGDRELYGAEITKADDLTTYKPFVRHAEKNLGKTAGYHELSSEAVQLLADSGADERVFRGYTNSGNRRYTPHTLENVVKILKKELRGGENFNYGVGSLRAHFTPQFRSVAQIKKAKGRLVSSEQFKAVKDEIDKEFFRLTDTLAPFYKHDATRFGFADTVISTMIDAAKMGLRTALHENQFNEVDIETLRPIVKFLEQLRQLPTEYFEAKITRKVDLSEFSRALVPKGTNPKATEALDRAGIRWQYYDRNAGGKAAQLKALVAETEAEGNPIAFSVLGSNTGDPALDSFLEKVGGPKRTLKQAWDEFKTDLADKLALGIFDKFHGIKRAENLAGISAADSGYISARLSGNSAELTQAMAEYGHPVWDGGAPNVAGNQGLLDILKPLGDNVNLWLAYIVAKRADRLMGEGRENLFERNEIDAALDLARQHPEFLVVAKRYGEFQKKVLDFAQEAGIINPQSRALWENADYVPFYRVVENGEVSGSASGGTLGKIRNQIVKLRGGEANIGDPLENILKNWLSLTDASLKAVAARQTVDNLNGTGLVTRAPQFEFKQVLIPATEVKKFIKGNATLVQTLKALGVDVNKLPPAAFQGLQQMLAVQAPTDPDVISVWRDGKREYWKIHDEQLFQSLQGISKKAWGPLMEIFRFPKRLYTATVTSTPQFAVKNLWRDMWHAFVQGYGPGLKQTTIPGLDTVKGTISQIRMDQDSQSMLAGGGSFTHGYIRAGDLEGSAATLRRTIRKKTVGGTVLNSPATLWGFYRDLLNASENSGRVAIYKRSLATGVTRKEALYASRDMLDFSMRGANPVIQFLTESVPFMNARLQGMYRLGRGFKENFAAIAIRGLLISAASLAIFARNMDDDRYKALTDDQKNSYWHFFNVLEEGDHWKLPKPFEVGTLFGSIPEAFLDAFITNADEPDAAKQSIATVGHAFANTLDMSPKIQAVMPILELAMNKNTFTGAPILNLGDKGVLPEDQDGPGVNSTYRALAHAMPEFAPDALRSPKQLQHLGRGYLGNIQDYVLLVTDAAVRKARGEPSPPERVTDDWPGLRDFRTIGPDKNTRYLNEMYNIADEAEKVSRSVKRNEEKGSEEGDARAAELETEKAPYLDVRKEFSKASDEVNGLRQMQREIQLDKTMSPSDKRIEINSIQDDINGIAKDLWDIRPGSKLNPTVGAELIGKDTQAQAAILETAGLTATAKLLRAV